MSSQLDSALQGVDWNSNVGSFCSRVDVGNRFHESNLRLAVWSRQLELIDKGNTAIPFVREMQHAGHNVACAAATGLYKPAAAAMRSLVECALYYSYFRTHPSELATLVRDDKYYVSKKEILQYFAKHVPDYSFRQGLLSLNERLEKWYSATSAIVHGQIPGQWVTNTGIAGIQHDDATIESVTKHFEAAVALVQDIFIVVLQDFWAVIETDAKAMFCKGMPGEVKTRLKLDKA